MAPEAWLARVSLRHLTRQDLTAIEWEGEYTHFRSLYAQAYRRARAGQAVLWVADLPSEGILGQLFVSLVSSQSRLADGVKRGYLHSFRLRPAYRGAGLGSRMLAVAEQDLQQRGFRQATLTVARDNLDAQRLYERLGYRIVAAEPGRWQYRDHTGRLRSVHEPTFRMEKPLVPE